MKCPGCGNEVSDWEENTVYWKGEAWHEECADEDREEQTSPPLHADICGKCGRNLIRSARFCPKCGAATQSFPPRQVTQAEKSTCPNCGSGLVKNARFCPKCGERMGPSVSEVSAAEPDSPATKEVYKEREIIREIVKIRCRNCGTLFEEKLNRCPHCGAPP